LTREGGDGEGDVVGQEERMTRVTEWHTTTALTLNLPAATELADSVSRG
jgi:hypothetical protein